MGLTCDCPINIIAILPALFFKKVRCEKVYKIKLMFSINPSIMKSLLVPVDRVGADLVGVNLSIRDKKP